MTSREGLAGYCFSSNSAYTRLTGWNVFWCFHLWNSLFAAIAIDGCAGVFVQHPVRAQSTLPISLALWSRSPPAAAAAPHTRQRTHTHLVSCLIAFLNYHNFGFQISGSLVGGGMCLWESSIDRIGQKWFEPHPDQIWLHWSMLMTMTMTMQFVVRLVEADGVTCLLDGWKN